MVILQGRLIHSIQGAELPGKPVWHTAMLSKWAVELDCLERNGKILLDVFCLRLQARPLLGHNGWNSSVSCPLNWLQGSDLLLAP